LAAACHFSSLPDYPHSRNIVQPPLIEYDVGDNALRDSIFKEPILVENGACVLPNRPGWASSWTRSPFAVSTNPRIRWRMSATMKVGAAIAAIIIREGVEILAGYPVNHLIEFAAAVDIRPVIVRQERIGLHMADAIRA